MPKNKISRKLCSSEKDINDFPKRIKATESHLRHEIGSLSFILGDPFHWDEFSISFIPDDPNFRFEMHIPSQIIKRMIDKIKRCKEQQKHIYTINKGFCQSTLYILNNKVVGFGENGISIIARLISGIKEEIESEQYTISVEDLERWHGKIFANNFPMSHTFQAFEHNDAVGIIVVIKKPVFITMRFKSLPEAISIKNVLCFSQRYPWLKVPTITTVPIVTEQSVVCGFTATIQLPNKIVLSIKGATTREVKKQAKKMIRDLKDLGIINESA